MLHAALDLLAPVRCAGCGLAGTGLCPGCRVALAPVPVRQRLGSTTLVAAHPYRGVVRTVLVAFKERGRRRLAGPLGSTLAAAVESVGGRGAVLLVPVPSRRAATRARGFTPTYDLAAAAVGRCPPGSAVLLALVHTRRVRDQAGLAREDRWRNLAGALVVREAARSTLQRAAADGTTVVVVDDVLTTGATATESVRALKVVSQSLSVEVAVVAAVGRVHGNGSPGGAPQGRRRD